MSFDKHIKDIRSGEVTKTNVIGIRKAINADHRRQYGWHVSTTAPKVEPEKLEKALTLLRNPATRPRVIGELHDSGMKQLKNKRYAKQLHSVADIVEKLEGFNLAGFENYGRHGEYATPLYEAFDTEGRSFFFINVPWQSGGRGPELLYR